jgi:hypothetical protein
MIIVQSKKIIFVFYTLWRGSKDAMSVEQCLALRVSLLQSKIQYRKQI